MSKVFQPYAPRTDQPDKLRGLGDMVYTVAHPVAKVIDAVLGTALKNCGGCAKRRERLNQAVPFKDESIPTTP